MSASFIFAQVFPASVLRYRPFLSLCRGAPATGLGFGFESASVSAYTISGLLCEIASPMRPLVVSGNPPPLISVQVAPPSVDFQSPDPGPPLRRKYGPRMRSQLDAYSVLGLRGSRITSMKPARSLMNLTSCHVAPPSVVL